MTKKSIAVIGLGRFGSTVAKTVANMGHEVLGVDKDEDMVQKISPYVTHAVVADTSDEDALRELSLNQFDVVVIGIGDNLQGNLMTAMLVKEIGVEYIIAKAQDRLRKIRRRNPIVKRVAQFQNGTFGAIRLRVIPFFKGGISGHAPF